MALVDAKSKSYSSNEYILVVVNACTRSGRQTMGGLSHFDIYTWGAMYEMGTVMKKGDSSDTRFPESMGILAPVEVYP